MHVKMSKRFRPELASRGQIKASSVFGRWLAKLAEDSEVIVELGTFNGLGSTYCFACGLRKASQRLYSIDTSTSSIEEARSYYDDDRVIFILGTLIRPDEVDPKDFGPETEVNETAPYVLDRLPKAIDLLLIDAGDWSGSVELDKLIDRTRTIALDDTRTPKNERNLKRLKALAWQTLAEGDDRNGWAILRRP